MKVRSYDDLPSARRLKYKKALKPKFQGFLLNLNIGLAFQIPLTGWEE
ncbi:hypothetical protein [Pseudomonas sp. NPDC089401]